jgi:putative DNA primase/helicase
MSDAYEQLKQAAVDRVQADLDRANGKTFLEPPHFLLTESISDEGNAQCLAKLHPDTFLYCPAFASPGWLYYNGCHWETEQAEVRLDRAMTEVLQLRAEAGLAQGVDEKGKLIKDALVKFCTPNAYRRKMAKDQLKSLVAASISDFDRNPDVINCANGVVNLQTGELAPHEPEQRFTYCLPVAYNPQADYGPWVTWLRDVVGNADIVQYLKLAVGYSLTGRTSEECLFYIYGPTRAGKGTFTETLLKLLGQPLSEGVDFATFTAKRDHDAQNFDLAGLKATRFIVASESNKYEILNPRRIKSVTGGDAIRCAHKHGRFFSYFPQFTIWLVSNNPVKADAEDDAIWARVNVIHFPNSYLGKEDKSLKRRMLERSNLEGVLRWAVEGAIAWYQSLPDGLEKPAAIAAETQQHRARNDYSAQFVEDCTERADGEFLPNPIWTAVYTAWCTENAITPKIGKARDKLKEKYALDRGYVGAGDLRRNGYDAAVKDDERWARVFANEVETIQQRGFYGVKIPEAVLIEYL